MWCCSLRQVCLLVCLSTLRGGGFVSVTWASLNWVPRKSPPKGKVPISSWEMKYWPYRSLSAGWSKNNGLWHLSITAEGAEIWSLDKSYTLSAWAVIQEVQGQ